MEFLPSLKGIKKSAWFAGATLAFLFSVSVCIFESNDPSLFHEPVFRQHILSSFVFCGALACIFTIEKPWIPVTVTVCGAALVGVFAGTAAILFFTVLFPALTLLLLARFARLPTGKTGLPLLIYCTLSTLMVVGILFLFTRIHAVYGFFGFFDFFRPASNKHLSGFWPLLLLFFVFIILHHEEKKRAHPAATAKEQRKQKKGKAGTPSRNDPVWLRRLPTLLYFVCAAFGYFFMWSSNEALIPYALLIDLSALFVLLGTYTSAESIG